MKKIMSITLVLILLVSMSSNVRAIDNDIIVLSELSDQEFLSFFKANGLVIPNIYDEEDKCIPFVRMVVEEVESNPAVAFFFNYHVLEDFAYEIKDIAINYYSEILPSTYAWSYNNILVENMVYGDWITAYKSYRCYSYVMGYTVYIQPGQIEWILLGNESTAYTYNFVSANVQTIAMKVKNDLDELGYTVGEPSTTMPNTNVSLHTHLICVRKDNDTGGDYHFMKLGLDGYWYHKPGQSNPLRYNGVPEHDVPWTQEGYDGESGRYYRNENITYESEIYYIEYTTPHVWIYESAGINQHTRTCTICGHEETSNCNYTYTYLYDDMHNGRCADCGGIIPGGFCSFTTTSNGDGTHTATCDACNHANTENCQLEYTEISDTHHAMKCRKCAYILSSAPCAFYYTSKGDGTHTKECNVCGQEQVGTAETCTYVYKSNGNNTHSRVCKDCGHLNSGPAVCMFKSDDKCRFCGGVKDSVVINSLEAELGEE